MRTRVPVVAAVAICCLMVPAWAEKGDMRVQFGVLYAVPTDDLQEEGETLELDESFGAQASFEYMVTEMVGIEPGLSSTSHDVEVEAAGDEEFMLGEIDLLALTVDVNFHVLQQHKFDLYVGPTIGYASWGDLETTDLGDFSADDDFMFGANVGLDVPFGSGQWEFSAGLSYLFTEITLEGDAVEPDLGVDPLMVRAGVSYKF